MICTDPATLQFGKEVSDGCWYYLQVRADSVLCKYEDNPKGFVEAYYNDEDVRRIIDSHTGVLPVRLTWLITPMKRLRITSMRMGTL